MAFETSAYENKQLKNLKQTDVNINFYISWKINLQVRLETLRQTEEMASSIHLQSIE